MGGELKLEKDFVGREISGYMVDRYINSGKSAAVFECHRGSSKYAIKIFFPEIVEKFGHEIQVVRIARELGLKNHGIDNLVNIIDCGAINLESNSIHFIVMDFIDGINIKQFIASGIEYDEAFIKRVIGILISVTEQLIIKGIAHRDVKPENIMIRNDGVVKSDV